MSFIQSVISKRWVLLLFLATFYCVNFPTDRPNDVDDFWFLSFSYNLCHQHITTDEFWQYRFPFGMDGTHLFGKLAAYSQGGPLERVGWKPGNAALVSIAFTLASLSLWWASLRRMGYTSTFAGYFVLLLGLARPVVLMTDVFRYEFFAFFLLSLALWLAAKRLELPALLVAFLAPETEPAAIAVALAVWVMVATQTDSRRGLAVKSLLAALIAFSAYTSLHPDAIQVLASGAHAAQHSIPGSMLFKYYLQDPAHLPDLLVMGLGATLFWINRARIPSRHIAVVSILLLLFLLIFPHPNPYYLAFVYPFWLLVALLGFRHAPRLSWIPVAAAGLSLLVYAHRVTVNRNEGYSADEIVSVSRMVHREEDVLQLNDDEAKIVGDWALWFTHPAHYLSSAAPTGDVTNGDLYLCYEDQPYHPHDLVPRQTCKQLINRVPLLELSRMSLKGHSLVLYQRVTFP